MLLVVVIQNFDPLSLSVVYMYMAVLGFTTSLSTTAGGIIFENSASIVTRIIWHGLAADDVWLHFLEVVALPGPRNGLDYPVLLIPGFVQMGLGAFNFFFRAVKHSDSAAHSANSWEVWGSTLWALVFSRIYACRSLLSQQPLPCHGTLHWNSTQHPHPSKSLNRAWTSASNVGLHHHSEISCVQSAIQGYSSQMIQKLYSRRQEQHICCDSCSQRQQQLAHFWYHRCESPYSEPLQWRGYKTDDPNVHFVLHPVGQTGNSHWSRSRIMLCLQIGWLTSVWRT